MKKVFASAAAKPPRHVVTRMRNVVENRQTPKNPEQRILPQNQSTVEHAPGQQVVAINADRATGEYGLSVSPLSPAAHIVDKAITAGVYKASADAQRRGKTYNPVSEGVTGPLSAFSDMRKEAAAARYEMRRAQPVIFQGPSVDVIRLGLNEMAQVGKRARAAGSAPYPDKDIALQEGVEASDLQHQIDLQLNPESTFDEFVLPTHLGSTALGSSATIELPTAGAMPQDSHILVAKH